MSEDNRYDYEYGTCRIHGPFWSDTRTCPRCDDDNAESYTEREDRKRWKEQHDAVFSALLDEFGEVIARRYCDEFEDQEGESCWESFDMVTRDANVLRNTLFAGVRLYLQSDEMSEDTHTG